MVDWTVFTEFGFRDQLNLFGLLLVWYYKLTVVVQDNQTNGFTGADEVYRPELVQVEAYTGRGGRLVQEEDYDHTGGVGG